ncbi:MAG: carbohydrate porin [Cupriavidus sp.]|nr:carbohydrate porin [Cupriavidus sp.]
MTTPTISTGNIDSKLFGHFRIGQGKGVSEKLTAFVGPNATSFQLGSVIEPDSSAVMLAQAWYQAEIPLPLTGVKSLSREKLTVNFGKMDPFGFFDQNAAANDETRQFLSSIFVHNALLDNPLAANVGADGFGFSPGLRLAYLNERRKPSESYGLSLGVFASGKGANFSESMKSPFVIAQAETKQRLFAGLEGNFRAYVWRNGQAPTFVAGQTERHSGFGLNFDQGIHDAVTIFARYGAARGNGLPFDRTASVGAQIGGSYWRRAADALGIAFGTNRASADFRAQSATLDADGNGIPDYGFAASGWEKTAEIYYRYYLHKGFELTPSFQWIRNPAANPDAKPIKILGARLQLSY